MPKLDGVLNEELPELPKTNVNVSNSSSNEANNLSIYNLIKKQKSNKKEQVGVTLNKDIVDKLKTVAIENNITLSKLFEELLTPLLADVVVKPELVEMYVNRNKAKGNRVDK